MTLGTSPVATRRGLSPASLAVSTLIHAVLVLLLFTVTFPEIGQRIPYHVTPLLAPEPVREPARSVPPRQAVIPSRAPAAPLSASPPRLFSPSSTVARPQQPVLVETPQVPQVASPVAPPPTIQAAPEALPSPVKTGGFETAATAAPVPAPRKANVQATSFQVAGAETKTTPAGRVAPTAFSAPAGARAPTLAAQRPAVAASAGFGSMNPWAVQPGGRARSTPPAAGAFGSVETAARQPVSKPQVSAGQFGTVTAKPAAGLSGNLPVSSSVHSPLEILDKPRPAYSDEARRLQIEGEVVLEAVFSATGQIRILRIVRGLGHGLDESAIHAAAAIRFRPETDNGRPLDTVAVVRIEFQLAY